MENSRLYEELRATFHSTVHALTDAVEMKDPCTAGHTRRVTSYALAIGRKLELPIKTMINLKLAAILHDVGMIGIKDEQLRGGGRTPGEEAKIIEQHVDNGVKILQHVKQLRDSLPGVQHHHEHYDGSGYPNHLKGDEIPLIARIIAVADGFDAMVHGRPYQKALGYDAAFRVLKDSAGKLYDPKIVEMFCQGYQKYGLDKVG